ncbi:unnamed protein product [Aphanomyces euteiches]
MGDNCTAFPRCAVAGPNRSPLGCCSTWAGCCSAGPTPLLDCCGVASSTTPLPTAKESSTDNSSKTNQTVWIVLACVGGIIFLAVSWVLWRRNVRRKRQIHVLDEAETSQYFVLRS